MAYLSVYLIHLLSLEHEMQSIVASDTKLLILFYIPSGMLTPRRADELNGKKYVNKGTLKISMRSSLTEPDEEQVNQDQDSSKVSF